MKVGGGRERVPVNNDELLLFSVLLGELGELRVHGRGDCLPLHLGGCFLLCGSLQAEEGRSALARENSSALVRVCLF